jgi:hypothetical protein
MSIFSKIAGEEKSPDHRITDSADHPPDLNAALTLTNHFQAAHPRFPGSVDPGMAEGTFKLISGTAMRSCSKGISS